MWFSRSVVKLILSMCMIIGRFSGHLSDISMGFVIAGCTEIQCVHQL